MPYRSTVLHNKAVIERRRYIEFFAAFNFLRRYCLGNNQCKGGQNYIFKSLDTFLII